MSMSLPRGSVLLIEAVDALGDNTSKWNKVTEHNRSEFSINPKRIENVKRMSNGSLRKYFVADKKEFSLSWDMLPSYRTLTVDGGWGAEDLRQFYSSSAGQSTFNIRVNIAKDGSNQESANYESYTVSIVSATFILQKRGLQPHWSVSLSLEEV